MRKEKIDNGHLLQPGLEAGGPRTGTRCVGCAAASQPLAATQITRARRRDPHRQSRLRAQYRSGAARHDDGRGRVARPRAYGGGIRIGDEDSGGWDSTRPGSSVPRQDLRWQGPPRNPVERADCPGGGTPHASGKFVAVWRSIYLDEGMSGQLSEQLLGKYGKPLRPPINRPRGE